MNGRMLRRGGWNKKADFKKDARYRSATAQQLEKRGNQRGTGRQRGARRKRGMGKT